MAFGWNTSQWPTNLEIFLQSSPGHWKFCPASLTSICPCTVALTVAYSRIAQLVFRYLHQTQKGGGATLGFWWWPLWRRVSSLISEILRHGNVSHSQFTRLYHAALVAWDWRAWVNRSINGSLLRSFSRWWIVLTFQFATGMFPSKRAAQLGPFLIFCLSYSCFSHSALL